MLLGLLLARQGVQTLVLERHRDFSREYRGEVLMPRFTQTMKALGLFRLVEENVHRKLEAVELYHGSRRIAQFPMSRICPETPYAVGMPQPVLLEAFRDAASHHPSFDLWFGTAASDLVHENGHCVGVKAKRDGSEIEVRARVTVGSDGRFSTIRHKGDFELAYGQRDFDVLWFSISEQEKALVAFRMYLAREQTYLVLPKYPDQLQCGMILPPDGLKEYHHRGIESLREDLLRGPELIHPFAAEVSDFSQFVLLQASLDLIKEWSRPGLLVIGDAAHTCSPAGAVGVSVAIQTAAIAAEVIPRCLKKNDVSAGALGEVQRLREDDVRRVHAMQKRGASFLASNSPWAKRMAAVMASLAPFVIERAMRKLVVGSSPYRPSSALLEGAVMER